MKTLPPIMVCFLILIAPLSFAQNSTIKLLDAKFDKAFNDLKKPQDIPQAWQTLVEIADIIKQHPEYNDGEYAEGIDFLTSDLLSKPWVYTKPYLIGEKSSIAFQNFIVEQVNEFSSPHDLKIIKKNILKNCDLLKYPVCKKILIKIEKGLKLDSSGTGV